jgi:lysophospholipase L1-like esterase
MREYVPGMANGRRWMTVVVCALALGMLGVARAGSGRHGGVQAASTSNPAAREQDRLNEPWWAQRHALVLEAVKQHPDTQLLMIGDSITNNYDKTGPADENFAPTWQKFYGPRKALNLGFSGDGTEHLLWRLNHGEVVGLHPRVAVVLIGTNNTGWLGQTAEQTERGIDAVVTTLRMKLPETKILLLGILPSALSPQKSAADSTTNDYLAHEYGDGGMVTYLDIGSIYFQRGDAHGTLNTSLFYDPRMAKPAPALHPDTNGQRMMAEAIEPTLAKLMGDEPKMPLSAMKDINTALIPVPFLEQDVYDWWARHNDELQVKQGMQPKVVMIGDSITHFWGGLPHTVKANGASAWKQGFGADERATLNLGFGWDRTQNVLWRLRQGEFAGLTPQWVVILIGTNNLTGTPNARANTPGEIVEGVAAIEAEVHRESPSSRIVVMAIFPRGESPTYRLRAPIVETNRLLQQRFRNDASVTYLDIGRQFLTPEGRLPVAMMSDGVHPTNAGYEVWGKALGQVFSGNGVALGR